LGLAVLIALASLANAADFSAWRGKMSFTFQGYNRPETLTNFPALVVLSTNLTGFRYADFLSTNADLRFTDASQTNELNYEIESWNTNGSSHVWVQVPRLVDTNTAIWAWWGMTTSAPAYTTNGATWSNGFAGVWHMSQTNAQDSTANRSHAITTIGVTNAAGVVNGADAFAGTASAGYLVVTNWTVLEPTQVTVSAWMKWTGPGTHSDGNYALTKGRSGTGPWISYFLVHRPSDNKLGATLGVGSSQSVLYDTVATASNTFAYVASTYVSGSHRLYRDGALCASNATSGSINYTFADHDLHLGDWGYTGWARRFQGVLDEVQISSVVRSSNWIWAAYMNMASNAVFSTNGPAILGQPDINNTNNATEITTTSATLNGYLTSTGTSAAAVGVYWGTNNGGTVAANWSTNAWLGQKNPGPVSLPVSALMVGTRYYYRFRATNDAGSSWALSSADFMTLGGPTYADNGAGATNIADSSATLQGLVSGGSPAANVYFFWNTSDGGTNKSDWTNAPVSAGTASTNGSSAALAGLRAVQTYYYRCYGSNANGEVWAAVSTNFTTLATTLAIADAQATKAAAGNNTVLSFPVTLAATSALPVTVDFATSNGLAIGGTDYVATNGTLTIPAGSGGGQIDVTVIGGNADQWPSVNLYMNLSNVVNATFADAQGLGTILVTNDVAQTNIWTGTGDWTSRTNWSAGALPSPSDTAWIQSGTVTVSSATTWMPSLTVSNGATLVFSNWMSAVNAGQFTVRNTAKVTHAPCAINVSPGNTNRVYIVCTNLTIDSGGSIDVVGMGYPGADGGTNTVGYGPGGAGTTWGASHGGRGYLGPATYGSPSVPVTPGSGGAYTNAYSGGGGVVWIEASGTATVNGVISANGANGGLGYTSGSGGSIYIACGVLAGANSGANGVISANGLTGGDYGHPNATAGGGRIAVVYDPVRQSGATKPTILFSASSINGFATYSLLGEPGTLYFPDAQLLTETIKHNGQLVIPGFTQWSPANLTLTNAWFRFPDGFSLSVSGNVSVIGANAALDLRYGNLRVTSNVTVRTTVPYPASVVAMATNSTAQIGGTLTLSNANLMVYGPVTNLNSEFVIGDGVVKNAGGLHLYAGATNGVTPYGLTLRVSNDVSITGASWIYPYSDATNGGSVFCTVRDLTTDAGGGFDASIRGYSDGTPTHTNGFGPGGGKYGGGGGYGGTGGGGAGGGVTYGDSNAPAMPGSGSGGVYSAPPYTHFTSKGGGLIWLEARRITHNGTFTANGQDKSGYWQYGSSGGGVYVRCATWAGTGGVVTAKGGNGNAGTGGRGAAGGGGRIAVWRQVDEYLGAVSNQVAGGIGYDTAAHGQTGTVVYGFMPVIDNGIGATNVNGASANLTGTLTATGTLAGVVGVCWGTNDGFNVLANWATNTWLGAQPVGPLSCPVSGLTAGVRYYYRFLVRDNGGDTWATSSTNFTTSGGPQSASNADGATNITDSSAFLCGTVIGGDPAPTAYFYWNSSDGGTNKAAWTNVLAGGTPDFSGAVSAPLSGLLPNHTYYYRCYGSNANGEVWAPVSTNFTTFGATISARDAQATKGPAGVNTLLSFPVTLSAISATPVSFNFSTSNRLAIAGSDYVATNGAVTIPIGATTAMVDVVVIGGNADQWPLVDLYLNLSNAVNASFTDAQGLGTILVTNDVPHTNVWTGMGNWLSRTNWSAGALPSPSDVAWIQSGTVTVGAATTWMPSLTVSNGATLVFSNWMSAVNAGQVTIRNTARVTHAPCAINVAPGNTNRVYFICTNLTVDSGGSIDVADMGYPGGDEASGNIGYGPGGGSSGSGASHGGRGYLGPAAYGLASMPITPGSGGANTNGGGGGGVVWVEASGTATVNGVISANGGVVNGGAAGAGGSIYLACRVLAGTNNGANGVISADGRYAGPTAGGGRIAVVYDPASQSNAARPTVLISARSYNDSANYSLLGELGTLYFPDAQFLTETITYRGQLVIPGFTQWNPANLTLTNAWVRFPEAFSLTVSGNVAVVGAYSALEVRNGNLHVMSNFTARMTGVYSYPPIVPSVLAFATGSTMRIDGTLSLDRSWLQVYAPATNAGSEFVIGTDCMLTNYAGLYLYAGATNAGVPYGLTWRVMRDVTVTTSSWVYAYSDATNGGSVFSTMRDLTIANGGGIDAAAKGFADGTATHTNGFGPGGGGYFGGGGYGGAGGGGAASGVTYGDSNAPALPGSGCGYIVGLAPARGAGGLIRIEATRMITLNGTMTANGQDRSGYWQSGGSGGGIYLRCVTWAGTGGVLTAKGGNAISYADRGSAGGGGRIAVWFQRDLYAGGLTTNAAGGTGWVAAWTFGEPGTIVFGWIQRPGSVFTFR
jgi:hypothetical protein